MTRARITAQRAYITQRRDAARLNNAQSLLSVWLNRVGSNVQDSDPVRVYEEENGRTAGGPAVSGWIHIPGALLPPVVTELYKTTWLSMV